ncbi:MAG: diaminopimelate epimerase [Flammeovirgaceae bacterium]
MKFPIIKCHGSENDFVMIDEVSQDYGFTEAQRSVIAQQLCDRKGPVGADGILYFVPSDKGDGMMRMFNPDGSEAEMCGNGIRCIGRLAHEVLKKPQFHIETLKGLYPMQQEEAIFGDIPTYSVAINTVSLNPKDLPLTSTANQHIDLPLPALSANRTFTAISLTNPHAIVWVEEVMREELEEVGEKANTDKTVFPQGVNVTFCSGVNEQAIFTGTYERGAGITFSCGTGMSAATIASCVTGKVPFNTWIEVYNQGGMVRCKVELDENEVPSIVHLLGNATYIFTCDVQIDEAHHTVILSNRTSYEQEAIAYQEMKAHVSQVLGKSLQV